LGSYSAPGNAGIYDIVNALVWVQSFIKHFGGDPNSVTIVGQSSGAAAITHLMTSPLTMNRTLFHKAIASSGTALNEWGTTENPMKASLRVSELAGCYEQSSEEPNRNEIWDCMRRTNYQVLVDSLYTYQVQLEPIMHVTC